MILPACRSVEGKGEAEWDVVMGSCLDLHSETGGAGDGHREGKSEISVGDEGVCG